MSRYGPEGEVNGCLLARQHSGAKLTHRAAVELTAYELSEIDRVAPAGAAAGTRSPAGQMHRLNV